MARMVMANPRIKDNPTNNQGDKPRDIFVRREKEAESLGMMILCQ